MDHIFFFVLFLCSFFPGCLQCSEFVWAEDCPVHTGHSVNSALSVFGALSLCLLALHFFCFFPFRCLKRSLPSQKLKRCTFKAVSHFTHLPVIFNVQSSFSKSTLSTIFYHFHPFHFMTLCVHACERERQLEKARGRQPIIDVAGWRCKTWRQIQGLDQRQAYSEEKTEKAGECTFIFFTVYLKTLDV